MDAVREDQGKLIHSFDDNGDPIYYDNDYVREEIKKHCIVWHVGEGHNVDHCREPFLK